MESTGIDAITTAITGMATSVQTAGLATIAAVLPVLGVLVAAIIVAKIGIRMIKRFSN